MKEEKLQEYASLLVRVGLNVQKGQTLVISAPVECAFFARMCAKEAYDIGCKEVVMNWHDDALGRMKYLHADDAVFNTVPLWRPISPSPPRTRRISRGWTEAALSALSRPAAVR